ncbi:hypothetical protein MBANPS3_008299 [Mucor bainieri]
MATTKELKQGGSSNEDISFGSTSRSDEVPEKRGKFGIDSDVQDSKPVEDYVQQVESNDGYEEMAVMTLMLMIFQDARLR